MSAVIAQPVTIFLSAAEASGDEHAANLIVALRRRIPGARFVGVAGERMAAAGCEVLADLTGRAAMLGGPILRLSYYVRTIKRIQRSIAEICPDVHVPVDSPAMNWHLASAAKEAGAAVVYYVAPQVWAWARWRGEKLGRLTDAVACILPFEQEYLRRRGVNATYVGHPIFDDPPARPDPLPDILEAWYSGSWQVALLPGSRPGEIRYHTKPLLAVAEAIRDRWPNARCTFATLREAGAETIRKAARRAGSGQVDIAVGDGSAQRVLAQSHFAVVGSGTVTLQAAYFGVPMAIFYRTGPGMSMLHRTLGKFRSVVGTPHFTLVNILAGRRPNPELASGSLTGRIVPELVPWRRGTRRLIGMVLEIMSDLGCLHETRGRLLELVEPLCVPPPATAAGRAADLIVDIMERRRGPGAAGACELREENRQ